MHWEVFLQDGRKFNIYEIDKVKQICDHYGIRRLSVPVDLNSKQFVDSYIAYLENMRKHHLFGLCHYFYTTASLVKQKVGEESVVFNGEDYDSLHNFGFSQYISIIYPDDHFTEYADKMKNYLYGPTFFKKIVENSYSEDFVYQLFKWHYGLNTTNDNYPDLSQRIFHYLYSFIFSHRRIPFAPDGHDFFNEVGYNAHYLPIIRTQLQQELEDVNSGNIYSVLVRLYCRYYLKGTNIMRVHSSIRDFGLRAALPYLDTGLLKFLERMPESWGRGLEMNHVKYPLKKFIEKRDHYPIDIVSKRPHSYISETDPGVNAYYEYICHSTLTEYFKEILSDPSNIAFLDQPIFNYLYIKRVIDNFLCDQMQLKHLNLLSNIAHVASVLNRK